jgi:hypothetical protein
VTSEACRVDDRLADNTLQLVNTLYYKVVWVVCLTFGAGLAQAAKIATVFFVISILFSFLLRKVKSSPLHPDTQRL